MKKYYCLHCRALHDMPNRCDICGCEKLKEIFISIQHNGKAEDSE
ncbi:hypothetical protein [Pradoshia sp.]